MRGRISILSVAVALLVLTGCRTAETVLGAPARPGPIATVRSLKPTSQPVTVRGRLIEKCPVAGCWFILQDRTGTVKVDTKAAGFVVTDVPLGSTVTVVGRLKTAGERRIAADGLRY